MKLLLSVFLVFALVFGLLVIHHFRESSCFSSPTCVLDKVGLDKENILMIYRDSSEWSLITYKNRTLGEVN